MSTASRLISAWDCHVLSHELKYCLYFFNVLYCNKKYYWTHNYFTITFNVVFLTDLWILYFLCCYIWHCDTGFTHFHFVWRLLLQTILLDSVVRYLATHYWYNPGRNTRVDVTWELTWTLFEIVSLRVFCDRDLVCSISFFTVWFHRVVNITALHISNHCTLSIIILFWSGIFFISP